MEKGKAIHLISSEKENKKGKVELKKFDMY